MTRLILASKSPRRKKLLEKMGLTFDVIPSRIEEITDPELLPEEVVKSLSGQKAVSVAEHETDAVIVAADTLVVHSGDILGQPSDEKEAVAMLQKLSGTSHYVHTGVTILRTDRAGRIERRVQFCERTKVMFAALSSYEIEMYVRSGSPLDKAGAYGIQDDLGAVFVSGIEGDFYNVVGLPVHRFYQHMKEMAPEMLIKARTSHD
ncbi:MAG: Maf family protein [Balneolaceae bacterium]